jgi:hypothetical protein
VRGPARIDGEEIVLDGGKVENYTISDVEDDVTLLVDLMNLRRLGEFVKVEDPRARVVDIVRLTNPAPALGFAERHGLLWQGPTLVVAGEVREPLKAWFLVGQDITTSVRVYLMILRAQEEGSAEPVRSYLRTLRDFGPYFKGVRFPDDDDELLEFASIQLAGNITRGMAECTPTLSAACGLLEDGKKTGGAGDFGFGNDPDSLVGVANYQLALFVSRKVAVKECAECHEVFVPKDPRQIEHRTCGNRKRQRKHRQKRRAG